MKVQKICEAILLDYEIGDIRAVELEAAMLFAELRQYRGTLGTSIQGAVQSITLHPAAVVRITSSPGSTIATVSPLDA